MGRLARLRGLLGLGVRRTVGRLRGSESTQTALSVVGVAVAIALMLTVTGVGLGLATGDTVAGSATDYWILPSESASSVVTGVEGQRLGQVHRVTTRIENIEGVTHATPVLVSVVRANATGASVQASGNATEDAYLLALGVIPPESGAPVVGIPTGGLTPGDPGYEGAPTNEVVLSEGAAETLGVDRGAGLRFAPRANRSFRVTAVEQPRSAGLGQLPVAVVHLSELQTLTGASGDSADRILVDAEPPATAADFEGIYPNSRVLTREERVREQVTSSQLSLAMGVASLLIAVVIGCLFVATTMGLELAADSETRAVLAAVGFTPLSRTVVVATQTLVVCALGGVLGVGLWVGTSLLINAVADATLGAGGIASLSPLLAGYGLAVALAIGLLTVPYLLLVSRGSASEVLAP
ncbi:ABC transporter permease [Natronomonas sp. EA1]|uniref:ABC transporter permease n=1 Tax=Natronomonas sp. EA1 TaxID=3421655 RepID=UPI003EB6D042